MDLWIDGNEINIDDVEVIDGEAFVVVAPGLHSWAVTDQQTGEVINEGEELCPTCFLAAPSPTPTPTPTPTGSVGPLTGTPTLPPTDTFVGPTSSPTSDGWRVMLVVFAGVLASVLILTPKRERRQR